MTERQFSLLLKGNIVRYEYPAKELCKGIGVTEKTMQNYISQPDSMRVGDLKRVAKYLKLRDEDVIDYLKGCEL
jgi:hypothetical protein